MTLRKVVLVFTLAIICGSASEAQKTVVTIEGNQFYINGKPTYEGRSWQGNKIEGLLMNSRMVQGIFDNLSAASADTFAYPDTKKWDAERNTDEFVAAIWLLGAGYCPL